MTRPVFSCLIAWVWIATLGSVEAQTPITEAARQAAAEPLSLEVLERMALEANPTLAQAEAAVDAARGAARQAGMLPNPIIGYAAEEVATGPVIRGGEHGVFIEQTIPLGGKLRLSREAFEQDAARAEAGVSVQRQRVLSSVRSYFYQALIAQRRVDVRERLAALSSEAVAVSGQLFNVGAADRPDLLESEIEATEARLELDAARDDHAEVWQRLATVVGNPALAPQPLAGDADAALPELTRDEVLQRVLEGSPELQAARAAVDAARIRVLRARREPVPDLFLRGGPMYNRERLEADGRPVGLEAQFEVGLSVPLFNRNQGGVAAAQAALLDAERNVERLELELRARLATVFAAYQTNRRRAEAYRVEILPRAEESFSLYLTRYREMAAAYPQALVAQRSLVRASDEYLDAMDRAWRAAVLLRGFLLEGGLDAPGMDAGSRMSGSSPEPRD